MSQIDIKLRLAQLHIALDKAHTTPQWPQTVADALRRIMALEKIVGDVHEAIGEDRDSEDDSLSETVRKIIADLKSAA